MSTEEKSAFTFFRSYYEAARELPDRQRLALYDAVIKYGLDGEELNLTGIPKSLFILIKPVLDKSIARAQAGAKGGRSKPEPNPKQTPSKSEAKTHQTPSDKDKDDDKDTDFGYMTENEGEYPPYPPEGDGAGPAAPEATAAPEPVFEEADEPKPRRRKPSTLTKTQEARFNRFWDIYPRKVSIGDAEKAWGKIAPDEKLLETILAAVETAKRFDSRFREIRYTPHPATWLNGKEWANQYDGPEETPVQPRGPAGKPDTLGVLAQMLTEEGGEPL
ncbi:MAG: hypothetical protein BWY85_00281 [Firmicutes bacterium ADurb.Bin506]|nr:MAG: hypothetical protein BWY85_00281 [Firmicutes bacterium ADurb.Bin506]